MPTKLIVWHNRRDTLLRFTDVRAGAAAQQAATDSGFAVGAGFVDAAGAEAGTEAGANAGVEAKAQAQAAAQSETADWYCHHPEDAQLQIPVERPYYSVYIPIGISPGTLGRHNITVEYSIDMPYPFEQDRGPFDERQRAEKERRYYERIGLDRDNHLGHITRITPDFIAHLRYIEQGRPDPRRIRPYLEMQRVFESLKEHRRPAYYEAVLHYVPKGARLRYRIKVYHQNRVPVVIPMQADAPADTDWYAVYVTAPTFTFGDIQYCPAQANTQDVNVGYWTKPEQVYDPTGVVRNRSLVTLRFDFHDVRRAINDFSIAFERPEACPVCAEPG